MAKYTIEIRDIIRKWKLFDFNYPFYDEKKRPDFEERFIKHFYFREICCDTVERFKVYLEDKMNTVFPRYNEMFKASLIEYDVLDNYKLTETYERTVDHSGKTHGVSSTVGQLFDNQETEQTANRQTDVEGNTTNNGNGTSNTITSNEQVVDGETTKNTSNTKNAETNKNENGYVDTVTKFLDTPSGVTSLADSKYLTTLTDEAKEHNNTVQGTETGTDTGTETGK